MPEDVRLGQVSPVIASLSSNPYVALSAAEARPRIVAAKMEALPSTAFTGQSMRCGAYFVR